MPTPNLDKLNQEKTDILAKLSDSVKSGDSEAMATAMNEWQQFVEKRVMEQATGVIEATDRSILAARGVRQLTTEETKFYKDFISSVKQEQDGVITNIMTALPETVIDSVMEDMKKEHPLLNLIDFTPTGAAIKWVLNNQASQSATWDELNTPITKEVKGAVEVVNLTLCKLTAYMFCTEDMLDLGPQWVDAYCRAVLADALAVGLETAIVDGDGLNQPV
jgi:HK97 family phage major capsid protein